MNIQSFLETYHPNYSNSNDVARYLDLDMYLSGEIDMSKPIVKELVWQPYFKVFNEYIRLQDKLFKEAFENYINTRL